MTAVPKPTLTPAEYLARERAAAFKSEYYRGETFAMAGARYPHNRVVANLGGLLFAAFRDTPCETLFSDMKVKVTPTGLYTYPDLIVVCGGPEFEDENQDVLLNPKVIFEVLSESTEAYDRGAKFTQYKRVDSLQEYVLVDPDQVLIERHVRRPDGWLAVPELTDPAGLFTLESVPVSLPVAEVYRGVDVADPPSR